MKSPVLVVSLLLSAVAAHAQTDNARISGRVTDLTGAVIIGAQCKITNIETSVSFATTTNENGIYVLPDLHPATYRMTIEKEGFRTVIRPNLQLYVQDAVNENFTLAVGPASESITVEGETFGLQTDLAAVSTVVNQQFVQNIPLNGRTFQSLLGLTPGYVPTVPVGVQAGVEAGTLSFNGQRANANYFMVDGMSWNFGIIDLGGSAGGTIPAFSEEGTTSSLVPVDAMQEFRVLTSTFAPEYGRTPGAQISIVTRSGTNQPHGTLFDYLRNNAFDARNYFDAPPLPKPPMRQNDFGGTLGAAIRKDRAFFFFSYEGLRLLLPETVTGNFYTAAARANVAPVYQPLLAALPIPNGPVNADGITAPLTASYSVPSSFDSYGLRIDYNVNSRMTLFGRYSRSPSSELDRYFSELGNSSVDVDSLTAGTTLTLGPNKLNDLRVNWSRDRDWGRSSMVSAYGAVSPPVSLMYPPGYNSSTYTFILFPGGQDGEIRNGNNGGDGTESQRQLEFADVFSMSAGAHQLKFGADVRQLTPSVESAASALIFSSYLQMQAGLAGSVNMFGQEAITARTYNYSLFAQDVWKATSRLTLTYGLRWEINTPLGSITGGKPLYDLNGIFNSLPIGLVPVSTLGHTHFNDFAPRVGASYLATPQTIVRAGFGFYYDLGFGAGIPGGITGFPYQSTAPGVGPVPLDLSNPAFAPPPFTSVPNANTGNLFAVDPNLRLPLVYEWNFAIERALGPKQSLSLTYLGSHGTNLIREDVIRNNLSSTRIFATYNADRSNYNALQVQFQRRMSRGLQALASYTFAKSLDTGSIDDCGCSTAESLKNIDVARDYGPSDFDIRHSFAAAISYEFPSPKGDGVGRALLRGWATNAILHISSAPPFEIYATGQSPVFGFYQTRPDIVPGVPFYVPDPTQPGGRRLNAAAFTNPPPDAQGDLGRNYFRGFPINQTDLAVSRRFILSDRFSLYFRVEYFNVFNHPNFAPASANFSGLIRLGGFGTITETLNNYLSGLSPLYQIGGPRSGQLTLKLVF